jgi:hypothetical protein
MTTPINKTPKLDPAIRDQRISEKARLARHLEKIAMNGTTQDKQAARAARLKRDTYIDVFAGDEL